MKHSTSFAYTKDKKWAAKSYCELHTTTLPNINMFNSSNNNNNNKYIEELKGKSKLSVLSFHAWHNLSSTAQNDLAR